MLGPDWIQPRPICKPSASGTRAATFHRTDLGGVLAWTVMIPATLTPQ
jgi:hypothetical protein